MASIKARTNPSGKKVFRVRCLTGDGSQVSATFKKKTDAEEWGKRRDVERKDGRAFGASRKTLAEAIEKYSEEELPKLAETERRNRVAQLAWWRERRGQFFLRDLTRPLVRDDLRDLRSGKLAPKGKPLSIATVNRYGAALSAVLSAAVDSWEWLGSNPLHSASRRKKPKGEREVERDRELSPEERQRLWATCRLEMQDGKPVKRHGKLVDARLYGMVVCAYASGARQAELMGMEWKRVQLSPRVRNPDTGETRAGVPRVTVIDTKTGRDRVLYFPGEAGEILREMHKNRSISPYVWARRGDAVDKAPDFPRQAFRCAIKRAGLEDFHFHDLRHMWACDLLDSGRATLAELMILGGWRTAHMARRYASRAQQRGSAPVERMHALISL